MKKRALLLVAVGLCLGAFSGLHAVGMVSSGPLSAGRVYPNPWRSDRHSSFQVTFDGLPANATIRLYTLSGQEVKTLSSGSNGLTQWDRTNKDGQTVASGIYFYSVSDTSGRVSLGKLAIIR
jgi:flagellar hook assembly protein FlgD